MQFRIQLAAVSLMSLAMSLPAFGQPSSWDVRQKGLYKVRQSLEQQFGSGNHRVLTQFHQPFPEKSNVSDLFLFKALVTKGGQSKIVFRSWDPEKDQVEREGAYQRKLQAIANTEYQERGWLTAELHDRVDGLPGDERLRVIIQVRLEGTADPIQREDVTEEIALEARRKIEDAAWKVLVDVVGKNSDLRRSSALQYGPFVVVELPARKLTQQGLQQGSRIALAGSYEEPPVYDAWTIEQALPATWTDLAQEGGLDGSGVTIALLESGRLTERRDIFNIIAEQNTQGGANLHTTMCAAIIGHSPRRGGDRIGYAPGASLLLANGDGFAERYRWASGHVPNIVSMSWHAPSEEDKDELHARDAFFDYVATHYPWPSVFTSAGNGRVDGAFASGKGYNFCGVGDVRLDGDFDRENDTMSVQSSFKNPRFGDRELPELSAPGSHHKILGRSFGGTSAATPATAAITALLMEEDPSLTVWPEAVRAILHASSDNQGADCLKWSHAYDGRDGTGVVNASAALEILRRADGATDRGDERFVLKTTDFVDTSTPSFPGNKLYGPGWFLEAPPSSAKGAVARVALTWSDSADIAPLGEPGSAGIGLFDWPEFLDADLDLLIVDSSDGKPVAWSLSHDNSYEFAEFLAKAGKRYEIMIHAQRIPPGFVRHAAVAWRVQ